MQRYYEPPINIQRSNVVATSKHLNQVSKYIGFFCVLHQIRWRSYWKEKPLVKTIVLLNIVVKHFPQCEVMRRDLVNKKGQILQENLMLFMIF
jgi:hypothetical protein